MMRYASAQETIQRLDPAPGTHFQNGQAQQERLCFLIVTSRVEQRDRLRAVPGGQPAAWPFAVEPAFGLKAGIGFPKIMEEDKGRQPRNVAYLKLSFGSGFKRASNALTTAEGLEHCCDISQVVDEGMPLEAVKTAS
jgi:hypothetical protein